MPKPILVLGVGIGWAATTPLYYTLSIDHQYCHSGKLKESYYLFGISSNRLIIQKYQQQRLRSNKFSFKKPPELLDYCKHTEEEFDTYTSLPFTLDKYINYYLQHYQYLKDTPYQAVADFSNTTNLLDRNYLTKIAPKLKEHFDVKVLIIYRDPVRRLFSTCNAFFYYDKHNDDSGYLKFFEVELSDEINKKYKSLTAYFLDTLSMSYTEIYHKFNDHFDTKFLV
jgi:hypothetical protein